MAKPVLRRQPRPLPKAAAKAAPKPGRAPAKSKRARRTPSVAFETALTSLIADEIRSVARMRVKDAVDVRAVRRLIGGRGVRLVDPAVLDDLVVHGLRAVVATLEGNNRSLRRLLGADLATSVDALLDEDPASSARAGDFAANLMRQEFMQRLFTDIVFTSIVSFNERVNPIFGRFAVGMLEDQIRGFIRLFMPMIVERAAAFAVSPRNQTLLFGLARSIGKRLLDVPLPSYLAMLSPRQKKRVSRIVEQSLGDAELRALTEEIALAAWDSLYERIRNERVGDLLRFDAHAGWLAERLVKALLPLLSRPAVARFIAAEAARPGAR